MVVPDPAPRPVRRSVTAAYRLAIVEEYEAAPRGEKGGVSHVRLTDRETAWHCP